MGWAVGYDDRWSRDIGYGVPAWCDHPQCNAVIDRGLAYVCCDQEPYGGEKGCGLYFCSEHTRGNSRHRCSPCSHGRKPYPPKPEHPEWIEHKLTDPSWQEWRDKHADECAALRRSLEEQDSGRPVVK